MPKRWLLLCLVLMSALSAATPETPSTVVVDGKEYPVYQFFKDVKPTSVTNPVYPARARKEGRGGETLVGAVVGARGQVISTFVARSTGAEDIQEAARAAVKQWKFTKLQKDGQPITYVVLVPIVIKPR